MTTAADDSAVEDAFEALLAGRPVPERAAGLAAFTGAVRASATRPGRPNAALAELLATGLLTDQSSPSAATARTAGSPPPRQSSRVRIRRRTAMIFPVLLTKFLAAGAVAQAATGAVVVVVAVTGVGAAGALPAPAQDTFSTVVAAVSPLEPGTSEKKTTEKKFTEKKFTDEVLPEAAVSQEFGTTDGTTGELEPAEDVEAQFTAWALNGPAGYPSFGAWVSEGSKGDVKEWLRDRGFTFGKVVSAWANGRHFTDEERAALGEAPDKPIVAPLEADTNTDGVVVEPELEQADVAATSEERGSRGNGSGQAKDVGKSQGQGDGKSNGASQGQGNGKGNGKN